MKRKYIMAIVAASIVALSGCSDFLDREPLTQPEATTFLSGATQVENYINGLYISLPSFNQWGMGTRGEEKNSDNIVAEEYDVRLSGQNNQFSGTSDWQTGYQNLREVNYFFHYYGIAGNGGCAFIERGGLLLARLLAFLFVEEVRFHTCDG